MEGFIEHVMKELSHKWTTEKQELGRKNNDKIQNLKELHRKQIDTIRRGFNEEKDVLKVKI